MIECIKFRPYEKDTLVGFADLWVEKWGVEIKGCQLRQKDKAVWVNMPSKEYETPEGEKYYNLIYFREKPHSQEFSRQAVAAIAKFRDENECG